MFGSVLGVASDLAAGAFDIQMLDGAIQHVRNYRWGHLPLEDINVEFETHRNKSNAVRLTHHKYANNLDRITRTKAKELRGQARDVLRSNKYVDSMLELKAKSTERKYSGTIRDERLAGINQNHVALSDEQELIKSGIKVLEEKHAVTTSERLGRALKDTLAFSQRFAYKRPILTGSAMVAAMVGIPLAMLYQTVKSAGTDAAPLAGTSSRPAPQAQPYYT